MKTREIHGKEYYEPEVEDVLKATDLGDDHTVEDWPWGRKQRCSMHFFVESRGNKQRFVKQSTMNGRTYKPKRSTYQNKVKIIELDGKIGHVTWNVYGMFTVNIEDGKYLSKTFFDEDAAKLKNNYFGFTD